MLQRKLMKITWCKLRKQYLHSTKCLNENSKKHDVKKIRNIGILAHIDAGKTTTTERMLFYSGLIKNMGEVHHGNTVTDYMEQERQRGITITSAAVTFNWKNHRFNLIDTPGHIDFTMEVEQALCVMDGAVVILDGSAGVEAQTLTVCRQADKYEIPKIIYVNKMDRLDANLEECLKSIELKLDANALPIQYPIKKGDVLEGLIDIISLEKIIFNKKSQGLDFLRKKLTQNEDKDLWDMANKKREILIDKLSNLDDKLADVIIEEESLDKITDQAICESLRRITLSRKGVPVLIGSSYKNIGVQPLMDSVILYLPFPDESGNEYRCFKNNLSARVFKIVHDKQRGAITFFRVYTGTMKKGDKIYNVRKEKVEQSSRLYLACADDYEEINEINNGNIAAVTGLQTTVTGDLITTSASVAQQAKKNMKKSIESSSGRKVDVFTSGTTIPDPVFFCSIEPPSLSKQLPLEVALQELEREDPSLRVKQDEDTGQTVLAGMGELHIDIIKERIRTEYKIDADLGPLQIAYKEAITKSVKDTFSSEYKIGKTFHSVNITMSLIPNYKGKEILQLDHTKESASNIDDIPPKMMIAIKKSIKLSLMNGPKLSSPVIDTGVKLHWLETRKGTSDTIVAAAVSQCIKRLMQKGESIILEPIMNVEIVVMDEYSSATLADLNQRRCEIQKVDTRGRNKIITAFVPLSNLLGYSTNLRIITSGNSSFTIEFSHYKAMESNDEQEAIKRITGF
ncbi:ribosome-releasing factor 2, mitochondrial [Polistes fuscatus]|uniref:ribosome-releasing factor 2, mitochondrial n=1 Tax=Polistes fuscatus TaxID=30207 RepID=UPI001CA87B44|nr:ribosome-releasing factor 2, mitochondrial [Polistes fuscatus]